MARQIEINYKNESGYEVLYPNVQVNNIIDLESWMSENYYSKSETDEKFITPEQLDSNTVFVGDEIVFDNDAQTASIAYTKIPKAVLFQCRYMASAVQIIAIYRGNCFQIYSTGAASAQAGNISCSFYSDKVVIGPIRNGASTTSGYAILFY